MSEEPCKDKKISYFLLRKWFKKWETVNKKVSPYRNPSWRKGLKGQKLYELRNIAIMSIVFKLDPAWNVELVIFYYFEYQANK